MDLNKMPKYTLPNGNIIGYETLTDLIATCQRLGIPFTPTQKEIDAEARRTSARVNAAKVIEVKNLTANQTETWLRQQVHGTDTESSINASIDSAVDIPALKVILKKINKMSYARTKSDKVIMELLIALRDEIMPDL
jgi:hypothetical protein